MNAASTQTVSPFSATLRARTADDHRGAERSPFMESLMSGALPLEGYTDMLAQHHYLYREIEGAAAALAHNNLVAPFLDPRLDRLATLDADLTDLAGPDWVSVHPASEPTQMYAARVREVASSWPGGYIAHHYTRYLGDLSGGTHIGRVAARSYGLGPDRGGRFAVFAEITDPAGFKDNYRALLDAAPWDGDEQDRVIDEIRAAYRFNTEVFAALDHHAA